MVRFFAYQRKADIDSLHVAFIHCIWFPFIQPRSKWFLSDFRQSTIYVKPFCCSIRLYKSRWSRASRGLSKSVYDRSADYDTSDVYKYKCWHLLREWWLTASLIKVRTSDAKGHLLQVTWNCLDTSFLLLQYKNTSSLLRKQHCPEKGNFAWWKNVDC